MQAFHFPFSNETLAKVFRSTAIEGCGKRPAINALVTHLSRYDSGFLDGVFLLLVKPIEPLIFSVGVANLESI